MNKKLYWLLLVPILPIILNYTLPLGSFSKIGGDNSLSVWLNFWATFSNTLIYSGITIFVLYKQIRSNAIENMLNRQQLKYQILQSQYLNLSSESERFVRFFNGSVSNNTFMSWLDGSRSYKDCQDKVIALQSELLSSWFKLSQLIPIQDSSFREQQEKNMKKLLQLYDFYIDIFQVKGTGILRVKELSAKEYKECFDYLHTRFPEIEILHDIVFEHIDYLNGYSDILYYKIVQQFCDYLNGKKKEINQYEI